MDPIKSSGTYKHIIERILFSNWIIFGKKNSSLLAKFRQKQHKEVAIPGVIYLKRGTAKSTRNFKSRYLVVKEETNKPKPIAIIIIISNKIGKNIISH